MAMYGFGAEPMLLRSNIKLQEKKRLHHIMAKVYLMIWCTEEHFKLKKRFEPVDLHAMFLKSIRSLNLFATFFLMELKECSKCIYEVPQKVKLQQLNLFNHFKIENTEAFAC